MARVRLLLLAALAASGLAAQPAMVTRGREYLEKTVQGAGAWVFQRSWRTNVTCPQLNQVAEAVLNLQVRKAMSGLPVQPPNVRIEHFRLTRQGDRISLRVELSGLPRDMEKSAEQEANKWLQTSAQGAMLRVLLLQPIGLPTFSQGKILKGAQVAVTREDKATADIAITPHAEANVNILGRIVRTMVVRVDKATSVVKIMQANFSDGAMLQVRFKHEELKTEDGAVFHVPSTVVLKQKGLDRVGHRVRLPATTEMHYDDFRIEAVNKE